MWAQALRVAWPRVPAHLSGFIGRVKIAGAVRRGESADLGLASSAYWATTSGLAALF